LATNLARVHYGRLGVDALAAIVGFTDIDPFVLSIAQGNISVHLEVAQAVLIASSSNNVLKGIYALVFGGRRMLQPSLALFALALCTVGEALLMNR
jgi:uncharacterized membrane protein (DUF4010 family)